jgi:hypothetical protein
MKKTHTRTSEGCEMGEGVFGLVKDAAFWLLLGLGINAAPHEFFAGVFMALAGAMAARHWLPEADRKEVWVVLLTALFVCVVAAELSQFIFPAWPLQPVMAASGFFSRYIVRIALGVAGKVETKTDVISDRVIDRVLPDRSDKDK